ncbi:hypothetical protein KJ840_05540 [Patescibacteria group bacterium]|nr:hypothetical protein [Patescibacteria group bacterium]
MLYKLAQLNIHDPHHSQKTGEILIQPGASAEESDFFILLEIDSQAPEDKQFTKNFLEIAFESYEKSKIFEPEKGLEKILQELNNNLPAVFPKKNYADFLHCFIGLYHEGHLFFSTFGKINVYLIKTTGIKKIGQETAEDNNEIFNFTLNGKIKDNDKILITTESLTNYISLEKIKKTVSALPPASSIAHLTNILQATPPYVSFFAVILTAPFQKEAVQDPAAAMTAQLSASSTSKNSLDQLLQTQRETEKILQKPSLLKSLQHKVTDQKRGVALKVTRAKSGKLKRGVKKSLLTGLLEESKKFISLIFLAEVRQKFFSSLQKKFTELFKKINQLSKGNKIFFIIIIILLLLFTQNLIWQSQKKSRLADEQTYIAMIQQIEEKQHNIEASLIYNDTPRAKQLLNEIGQLLENFPQDSKERIAKYQELDKNTKGISEKVWKIINIAEPIVLFDFREINLGAQIFEIALKDNFLYGLNSTDQLFLYNLADNQKTVKDDANYNLKNLALTPQNLLIGHTPEKRFYSLSPDGLAEINVTALDSSSQIDDLTFFLDKMYLLDKNAKQIYRYTNYSNNFQAKAAWVKEDLPIEQAVSITVDGYVYALLENGEILKMGAGKKQDFPKIITEPELASPTKIYTAPESENLFVLEPANKRFLIINRDSGELKNQYFSEKFTDLKDFEIREVERKVYLLNGSQVIVVGI